ncbi:MAG: pyridoxamine 5'-phosphate oxidase family protein [Pseudomonadota bacterium]
MRRKEKEILNKEEIESIIRKSAVCRLAMAEKETPYVVPLCFGYDQNTLFFHSATEGKKLDILRKNNSVCVEFDTDHEILKNEKACRWGMRYASVIAFGKASFVEHPDEKRKAMDLIMRQYSDAAFHYSDEDLGKISIIRVTLDLMTGKRSY